MIADKKSQIELEHRIVGRVMDAFVRIGLVLVLAFFCYRALSPFLTLLIWSLILAVALYPLHDAMARKLGGRHGLAATLMAILGLALIVAPTAVLMNSLGEGVRQLVQNVQSGSLEIPAPIESVAAVPIVGPQLHAMWSQAHADLPALLKSLQPQLGDIVKLALGFVGGIGVGLLLFLVAFIIAGIVMAFGEEGARASLKIFRRIFGPVRGEELAKLSTATVRAVAQGVIGVAFIQGIIVGLCLLIAGVPWPGLLALIVLVLGIAQIPALVVTLPAIGYIWWTGTYGNVEAIAYSVLLFVAGLADNVLKPLMLGRGVKAPMVVILLGALGGMASAGILGMFVGATLLTLGYKIFMAWVENNPDAPESAREGDAPRAS
jgi:predicted PurR-regulated permease PerM